MKRIILYAPNYIDSNLFRMKRLMFKYNINYNQILYSNGNITKRFTLL